MKNNMTIQDQLNYLYERLNRIEEQLATNHNSVADAIKPTEPDYTHLLPEGYEFCAEQDAEKWVKVECPSWYEPQSEIGQFITNLEISWFRDKVKALYRPIRKIKYHVAVHEVVTAEKDPYQPDWTKAPRGTVAHSWDGDGKGYWYRVTCEYITFCTEYYKSEFALPSGLDWKQSLRVNPNFK